MMDRTIELFEKSKQLYSTLSASPLYTKYRMSRDKTSKKGYRLDVTVVVRCHKCNDIFEVRLRDFAKEVRKHCPCCNQVID